MKLKRKLKFTILGLLAALTIAISPVSLPILSIQVSEAQLTRIAKYDFDYLNLSDAITQIGSADVTLIITGPNTLDANTTFPSTLGLEILKGGSITKASTYTLTINGPFSAGLYKVFYGFAAGDVTGLLESKPEWWGAAGVSATVDTLAMQCAARAMTVEKSSYILSSGKTYLLNDKVSLGYSISRYQVIAYGSLVTCSHNGIAFDLNSDPLLDHDAPNDHRKYPRWYGGQINNTVYADTGIYPTAAEGIRAFGVESARLFPEKVANFWKGINVWCTTDLAIADAQILANTIGIDIPNWPESGGMTSIGIHIERNIFTCAEKTAAIRVQGKFYNLHIRDNIISGGGGSTTQVYIENGGTSGGAAASPSDILFEGNHLEQAVAGDICLHLQDTVGANVWFQGVTIVGNTFGGAAGTALVLDWVWGVDISSNAFFQTGTSSGVIFTIDENSREVVIDRSNRISTDPGTMTYPVTTVSGKSRCTFTGGGAGTNIVAASTITLGDPWSDYFVVTGNTGITSITASWVGRKITLEFTGTPTITDGSNIKGAGDFGATADDTISYVCNGTNWYETGRSVN